MAIFRRVGSGFTSDANPLSYPKLTFVHGFYNKILYFNLSSWHEWIYYDDQGERSMDNKK